jgi:hypothetical protein
MRLLCDLACLFAKQVLSQLSYTPMVSFIQLTSIPVAGIFRVTTNSPFLGTFAAISSGAQATGATSQRTRGTDSWHTSGPASEKTAAEANHQSPTANVYLQREYLAEHNQRFARAAAKAEDYHRRAPRVAELDRIFRLESERTISEDWVVRYDNRFFQLEPQNRAYAPAQSKVRVCEGRHGSIAIEYRGRALRWQQISAPVRPQVQPAAKRITPVRMKQKWAPPVQHPWRQAIRKEIQKRASKLAAVAMRRSLARPSATP